MANPVVAEDGGVRNLAFYYGGLARLADMDEPTARATLGSPAIVVTTRSRDEEATVETIHSLGAKAYRYVQFYWTPGLAEYDGLDLRAHPGWAFCRKGTKPSLGRTTADGAQPWYFLDANEREVRAHFARKMQELRSAGWDGVFIDRGEAATQSGVDASGRPTWSRRSTCTAEPHDPEARFADAFVSMVELAHEAGLEAMMNNGKSPLDPVVRMRPDPQDRHCRRKDWPKCSTLNDAWTQLDLVLNETATRPKLVQWDRTFAANKRSERSAAHGRRTVALITTSSLGGVAHQNRRNVFYAWSRVKLFDLAVAVNTGDDGCASAAAGYEVCNRHGLYPELVDIEWGPPRASRPSARDCSGRSESRCVWTRGYRDGINVLNATARVRPRHKVALQTKTCRYVFDVLSGAPLAGNRCVLSARVGLGKWSGHPLLLSKTPW